MVKMGEVFVGWVVIPAKAARPKRVIGLIVAVPLAPAPSPRVE